VVSLPLSPALHDDVRPCGTHACLGCPAIARDVLRDLVVPDAPSACLFDSHALEARERVPAAWLARHGLAIVRRGYLIRERVDAAGLTAAIDVVGPGCCFPIDTAGDSGRPRIAVYAVTRALVCACSAGAVDGAIEHGGRAARELHALEREALTRMERLAEARARSSPHEKVAALLCAMADTLRPGQRAAPIPGDFHQRDLAALLSIRHESVCRALRDLTKRGLIIRGADGIAIADQAKLERVRARRRGR
jgi:CRP-like cAMP-binding protein